MGNVRRFFRYDVEIPIYLQTIEAFEQQIKALHQQVFPEREQHRMAVLNSEIEEILAALFEQNPQTMQVFWVLNRRIDFMGWLLAHFMDLKDPREAPNFSFRLREDAKHEPPKAKRETKLLSLMQDFYYQIDECIHELLSVASHSYQGKIFLFPPTHRPIFEVTKYVQNLETLAKKGILPAKVLVLLVEKFNLYVLVLNRLKERYRMISDYHHWPVKKVNLSAGGLSFFTNDEYERFAHFQVLMKLEADIVVCEGHMVMVRKLKNSDCLYQVGVEFEFVPIETQRKITLFIQHQELKEAMQAFPDIQ